MFPAAHISWLHGLCAGWKSSVCHCGNSRNLSSVCFCISVASSERRSRDHAELHLSVINGCYSNRDCMTTTNTAALHRNWKSLTAELHAVNFQLKTLIFFVWNVFHVCVCCVWKRQKNNCIFTAACDGADLLFYTKHSGRSPRDRSS